MRARSTLGVAFGLAMSFATIAAADTPGVAHPGPMPGPARARPHRVTLDAAEFMDVDEGSLPNAAYPEGTIFGTVYEFRDGGLSYSLAEVDVARGRALHRVDVPCGAVLRSGAHVYAECAGELIAFEASTLSVEWRAKHRLCPLSKPGEPLDARLFANPDLLVIVANCDGTQLGVVDLRQHRVLSEVFANVFPWSLGVAQEHVYFHGPRVIFEHNHGVYETVLALSSDYRRVQRRIVFPVPATVWDDGSHLHFYQEASNVRTKPIDESDTDFKLRPTWLTPDVDHTLSDALQPVGAVPYVPVVPKATGMKYESTGLMGDYIIRQIDVGTQRFWLTGSMGGGPSGLSTSPAVPISK